MDNVNQSLNQNFLNYIDEELVDYEKVEDSALNQQLWSIEKLMDYEEVDIDSALSQQQLSEMMMSLGNELMDYEKVDDAALSQQQLSEMYQSSENEVSDSLEMRKSSLNQQLLDQIQSLENEGLVSSHFRIAYLYREEESPNFFLDLVPIFLRDARSDMHAMANALEWSDVDFDILYARCVKLKGSAASIGACKLTNACAVFIQAVDKKSKDECSRALKNIREEYLVFRRKSESIMQLEKEIVKAESSKS